MIKNACLKTVLLAAFVFTTAGASFAQTTENWTSKQLVEPADLAREIKENKKLPVIISVGPGAPIPHSLNVGMVNNIEGVSKLRTQLTGVAKDKKVVIYCGCCPFDHCPNVRPAIEILKELKYTNYHLLNLPNNIKKDWIDQGYPTTGS